MAESEEELKTLLMKVQEESEKADLKLSIQKKKNHDICSYPFMSNGWGKNENSDRLNFLGLQNYWRCWLQLWNLKDVCCFEEKLKSILIKVKEESEKADLKLNIQKT